MPPALLTLSARARVGSDQRDAGLGQRRFDLERSNRSGCRMVLDAEKP
jgi:hypothetical protein